MRRLVFCILIVIAFGSLSQAQILQKYDLTEAQEKYVYWLTAAFVFGSDITNTLDSGVWRGEPARSADRFYLKKLNAKTARDEASQLRSDWNAYHHPAPFHETDKLLGQWIATLDTLCEATLVFYGDEDFPSDRNAINRFLVAENAFYPAVVDPVFTRMNVLMAKTSMMMTDEASVLPRK